MPKTDFIAVDQAHIARKIQEYLRHTGWQYAVPKSLGYCSGLAILWLYRKRQGEEALFFEQLQYLSTWEKPNITTGHHKEDPILEELLGAIRFLHDPNALLPGTSEATAHVPLNIIKPDNYSLIAEPEFQMSFVFKRAELVDTMSQIIKPNKMILLGNNFHSIAVMLVDSLYSVYDPNHPEGAITFDNIEDVINEFDRVLYRRFNYKNSHIALNIDIYDIESKPIPGYPDPLSLADHYIIQRAGEVDLSSQDGATALLMAVRAGNVQAAEYYLKQGASLKGPFSGKTNLLYAAVSDQNIQMVELLLKYGASPNNFAPHRNTILSTAVRKNNPELVRLLLRYGSDISEPDLDAFGYTPLESAINHQSKLVLGLLMGAGVEIGRKDFNGLKKSGFTHMDLEQAINEAKIFSRELLGLTDDKLVLEATSTSFEIQRYLDYLLRISSHSGIEDAKVVIANKLYEGTKALSKLVEFIQTQSERGLFEINEHIELYDKLKLFKDKGFSFKGSNPLCLGFEQAARKIETMNFDHLELSGLRKICDIYQALKNFPHKSHGSTSGSSKSKMKSESKKALSRIEVAIQNGLKIDSKSYSTQVLLENWHRYFNDLDNVTVSEIKLEMQREGIASRQSWLPSNSIRSKAGTEQAPICLEPFKSRPEH